MVTPEFTTNLDPFWDDSFKRLPYDTEKFNNPNDIAKWLDHGYSDKFTGAMCDMRRRQPLWNKDVISQFEQFGWKDVCTSYYRMDSGTILPVHRDLYKKYIELYQLTGKEYNIRRAIIFLEDWASGHYLEIDNIPVTSWKKGFCVIWPYDTPHMAANMGLTPRYTLQVTGHL